MLATMAATIVAMAENNERMTYHSLYSCSLLSSFFLYISTVACVMIKMRAEKMHKVMSLFCSLLSMFFILGQYKKKVSIFLPVGRDFVTNLNKLFPSFGDILDSDIRN